MYLCKTLVPLLKMSVFIVGGEVPYMSVYSGTWLLATSMVHLFVYG